MAEHPDWNTIFRLLKKWRAGLALTGAVEIIAEEFNSPWAVLVSTLISLRTKDEVTLPASRALLASAPTPAAYLQLSAADAERLIYPAGFYRTKSKNLRRIAEIIGKAYHGEVPAAMEELLALPGVGRKTANLVLAVAFHLPAICVDTHVHRICNRAGWTETVTTADTEMALRENLPPQYWAEINELFVLYGQRVCRPISPFCSQCVIAEPCARKGVKMSR